MNTKEDPLSQSLHRLSTLVLKKRQPESRQINMMTWHLKHERSIFKHYSSLYVTTGTHTRMMILLVFKQTTMRGVKIKKNVSKGNSSL